MGMDVFRLGVQSMCRCTYKCACEPVKCGMCTYCCGFFFAALTWSDCLSRYSCLHVIWDLYTLQNATNSDAMKVLKLLSLNSLRWSMKLQYCKTILWCTLHHLIKLEILFKRVNLDLQSALANPFVTNSRTPYLHVRFHPQLPVLPLEYSM